MPNEQKSMTQLQTEAVEFLQRQYRIITEQIKQLLDYRSDIEEQILRQGGVVPSEEMPLYELVERSLSTSFRMQREDDLISNIVSENSWLVVRNPDAQIQKAITQSCKVWKNKPTKFFRHNGWVGLYSWKQWILEHQPIQANLQQAIMHRFDVKADLAKGLADSMIESGALQLTS